MSDEPLLSPRRIVFGIALWAWMIVVDDPPVYVPFWRMVIYHRRPNAAERHDAAARQGG